MACIFCGIINGEVKADLLYEDDYVVGFRDIQPQSPSHTLVVPKKHVSDVLSLSDEAPLISHHIFKAIRHITDAENLSNNGFRVVTNKGDDGGQTVDHLHFHILGGRQLNWPPG